MDSQGDHRDFVSIRTRSLDIIEIGFRIFQHLVEFFEINQIDVHHLMLFHRILNMYIFNGERRLIISQMLEKSIHIA